MVIMGVGFLFINDILVTKQWADASGACLADALAEYAKTTDVPLSELVDEDGSFGLKGDGSKTGFNLELDTCIERAWEAVGASLQ